MQLSKVQSSREVFVVNHPPEPLLAHSPRAYFSVQSNGTKQEKIYLHNLNNMRFDVTSAEKFHFFFRNLFNRERAAHKKKATLWR